MKSYSDLDFFATEFNKAGFSLSSSPKLLLLCVCGDYLDLAIIAGWVNCLFFYSEETYILSGFGLTQKHSEMISQSKVDSPNLEFE